MLAFREGNVNLYTELQRKCEFQFTCYLFFSSLKQKLLRQEGCHAENKCLCNYVHKAPPLYHLDFGQDIFHILCLATDFTTVVFLLCANHCPFSFSNMCTFSCLFFPFHPIRTCSCENCPNKITTIKTTCWNSLLTLSHHMTFLIWLTTEPHTQHELVMRTSFTWPERPSPDCTRDLTQSNYWLMKVLLHPHKRRSKMFLHLTNCTSSVAKW